MEIVIWCIVWSLVVAVVADQRKLPGGVLPWFFFGLLFSVIALIVALIVKPDPTLVYKAAILSGDSKKCPKCAELVKAEAVVCRFCSFEFSTRAEGHTKPSTRLCIACSKPLAPTAERCSHCGYEMRRQA